AAWEPPAVRQGRNQGKIAATALPSLLPATLNKGAGGPAAHAGFLHTDSHDRLAWTGLLPSWSTTGPTSRALYAHCSRRGRKSLDRTASLHLRSAGSGAVTEGDAMKKTLLTVLLFGGLLTAGCSRDSNNTGSHEQKLATRIPGNLIRSIPGI